MLVACTLLVTFLDVFSFENKFDILDFYAGAGRLARGGRTLGVGCNTCLPKVNSMSVKFKVIYGLGITSRIAPEVKLPAHSTLPMLSPMRLTSTPMLDSRCLSSHCVLVATLIGGRLSSCKAMVLIIG